MATRPLASPSPKLLALQKDFQQIAAMAGFLNSSFDLPQLRLFFTLYGRLNVPDLAEGQRVLPLLQAWCDRICLDLREGSSGAILPPQLSLGAPQPAASGDSWQLVATLSFGTKVTDNSYLRVRTAVLAAYQAAAALREQGVAGLGEAPAPPLSVPEPCEQPAPEGQ
jgi:hypothetical protein